MIKFDKIYKRKGCIYMSNEKSLFSRLSLVSAGLSFFVIPLVFSIVGIILGIIGLLKQEEQKMFAVIGIIVCIVRLVGALALT